MLIGLLHSFKNRPPAYDKHHFTKQRGDVACPCKVMRRDTSGLRALSLTHVVTCIIEHVVFGFAETIELS